MSHAITSRLRAFIFLHFPVAQQRQISDADPLLDSGIVDSMGILDIVTFIENEFGLTLDDDEMIFENFASIATLAAFIQKKLSSDFATAA